MKIRVRELRKEKGLSGIQISSQLGISVQHLYDIEKGKRRLNTLLAVRLAEMLDVSTDYLLGIDTENGERNNLNQKEVSQEYAKELELLRKENAKLRDQVQHLKQAFKHLTKGW